MKHAISAISVFDVALMAGLFSKSKVWIVGRNTKCGLAEVTQGTASFLLAKWTRRAQQMIGWTMIWVTHRPALDWTNAETKIQA
jgi:hypothetical protein